LHDNFSQLLEKKEFYHRATGRRKEKRTDLGHLAKGGGQCEEEVVGEVKRFELREFITNLFGKQLVRELVEVKKKKKD